MSLPFAIPNIRRECSMCYELLYLTYWEYNANMRDYYMIGSISPDFISNPTLTVKAFCPRCRVETTREYRDSGGVFVLIAEQHFQEHHMLGSRDLITYHV